MRKTNKVVHISVFIALMVSSLAAHCETNPLQEIERINKEISILSKKQEFLDAQYRYSEAMKRSSGTTNEVEAEPPKVKAIEGISGRFIATCVTQNGAILTRSIGEEIPGGWKVELISANDVTFTRGKKSVRVPVSFGNEISSSSPIGLPSGMPMPTGMSRAGGQ